MSRVRVLLAEDHETVREGLRMIISREPDMEIVGEASDGREAVEKVSRLRPHVVVMDISMPGMNGLKATRKLKAMCPEVHVVALTRHKESGYLHELLQAGASGYVRKQSPSEELIRAVRAVGSGKSYLDPAVTSSITSNYAESQINPEARMSARLSGREAEIIRLIALGYSNKE